MSEVSEALSADAEVTPDSITLAEQNALEDKALLAVQEAVTAYAEVVETSGNGNKFSFPMVFADGITTALIQGAEESSFFNSGINRLALIDATIFTLKHRGRRAKGHYHSADITE